MPVHVFFKAFTEGVEQFVALFGNQFVFFCRHIVGHFDRPFFILSIGYSKIIITVQLKDNIRKYLFQLFFYCNIVA